MIDRDFWRGRRVFLTGHTGFKGSWLALWLKSLGAQVHGYAQDPPTQPHLFGMAGVSCEAGDERGDIRDLEQLSRAVMASRAEVVFHLAAQSLVRKSYQEPVATYATNVMGVVNLLEAVRKAGTVKAVVNVTTDKCYENREWVWGYREDEPMGGFDPYSNSKGCAELVTSAYRRSFLAHQGIRVATARAGNVIGGGDWAEDRLIPDILRALGRQQPVMIRNPGSLRPWQHVLEPLGGYLLLAQQLCGASGERYAQAWNFGPDDRDTRNVEWIVSHMTRRWGDGASWARDAGHHPHEAHYLKLDISKAQTMLNWRPAWSLETALEKIIEWHKAWLSGAPVQELCLEQIRQYQDAIPKTAT